MRLLRKSLVAALLLLSFTFAACGGKRPSSGGPINGVICRDVVTLPQNLAAYAPAAGGGRALAAPGFQEAAAARQKERHYRPWQMTEPSRRLTKTLANNFNMKPERAYVAKGRPFPRGDWEALVENSNKAAYPAEAARGVTLRHSDLRAMPTSTPFYLDPDKPGEGYPFDYFQHTSLPMSTPVFISHVSKDGLWLLVESGLTAGWLPAADVARVGDELARRWQERPLAALIGERVSVGDSLEHIGALLPLAEDAGGSLRVWYPVRAASAEAGTQTAVLGPDQAVPVPLLLTPDAVARIGNKMMGQAYGWGGIAGLRDCSALTRDLFAPFGLWLPRNSGSQAKLGAPLPLTGMSPDEKERRIAAQAPPFASLIWLPGHIGLYLGQHQGKPVMFHNIWGLRTREADGSCEGRAVIGKAVVTTLRPGAERPDLCVPTILERIERVVVLQ